MPSTKRLGALCSLVACASAFAIPTPQVWELPNSSVQSSTTTSATSTSGSAASSAASAMNSVSATKSAASATASATTGARTGTITSTGTATATGVSAPSSACPTSLPALQCYRYASSFPPPSSWLSWQCLTSLNYPTMLVNKNDSPDEAENVISAIQSVAQAAGIDPRIAYAVVMQESTGKVRPIHGDSGLSAGIFQVQIPSPATCDGTTYNTCPLSTITTMAQDGIYGHNGTESAPIAPGIAYWLGQYEDDEQGVASALRLYNTGSIPDGVDLTDVQIAGKNVGTPAYVSDVGNRLTGGLVGSPRPYECQEGS